MDEDRLVAVRPQVASRVIMHVDLDAFYAQVEMRRLDLDPTKPCCVQQWSNLIAVNYPARATGISRHISATNARRLCPEVVLVHVETLDEAGRVVVGGAVHNQTNTKVSLARYRTASYAIFALLVRLCGEKRCEKASVDEAFIDITALAEELLATGRLPPQFASTEKSRPQRWCAAGWLRRQSTCPCSLCTGGARREELATEGYSQLCEETDSSVVGEEGRAAPDGSMFFRPPAPAQRWALRHPSAAPAVVPSDAVAAPSTAAAAAAAAAAVGASADTSHSVPLDGAAEEPPYAEAQSVGAATVTTAAAPGITAAAVEAAWAQASQYPFSAAADCIFAVLAFAGAGRWHVLDDTGRNADAAAASLATNLATPLAARLCAGAVVAECIRRVVYEELHLTCSTGVAHNKMLAKLASARNKPDRQTLVLAQSVPGIMRALPLQKIRGLGGKLGGALCSAARAAPEAAATSAVTSAGSHVVARDAVAVDDGPGGSDASDSEGDGEELLGAGGAVPPAGGGAAPVTAGSAQQLSFSALCSLAGGEERASAVYRLLRGIDDSEITARSKPKQISAAKSFAASSCATFRDACSWLRMLCAEVDSRATEDVALFSRVPTTLVLHYSREGGSGRSMQWHSKSTQLHRSATGIFNQAVELLRAACIDEGCELARVTVAPATTSSTSGVEAEVSCWASEEVGPEVRWSGGFFPCSHLSVSLSGFNDAGAGMAGSAKAMQAFLSAKPLPAPSTLADGAAGGTGGSAAFGVSGSVGSSQAGVGQKRPRGPSTRPVSIIAALQRQSAIAAAAVADEMPGVPAVELGKDGARAVGTGGAGAARPRQPAPPRQADLGLMFRASAAHKHYDASAGPPMPALAARAGEVVDLVSSDDDGNA